MGKTYSISGSKLLGYENCGKPAVENFVWYENIKLFKDAVKLCEQFINNKCVCSFVIQNNTLHYAYNFQENKFIKTGD